jgi:hypothetical protein
MKDLGQLQKRQDQIFILVCINCVLFMVLFTGLGYVIWQSATLANKLKGDLDRAEQRVVELQQRFRNMEMDVLLEKLVSKASERLEKSIKTVVQDSEFTAPLNRISQKMTATHDLVVQTGDAIHEIHETVKRLDNEEIAELVSYHILKGLGDGFQQAAETRKPVDIKVPKQGSSNR